MRVFSGNSILNKNSNIDKGYTSLHQRQSRNLFHKIEKKYNLSKLFRDQEKSKILIENKSVTACNKPNKMRKGTSSPIKNRAAEIYNGNLQEIQCKILTKADTPVKVLNLCKIYIKPETLEEYITKIKNWYRNINDKEKIIQKGREQMNCWSLSFANNYKHPKMYKHIISRSSLYGTKPQLYSQYHLKFNKKT